MTKRRAGALALLPLALAACAPPGGSDEVTDHAASLWAARTPDIGDSRVAALVAEVAVAPAGSHTLELSPAMPPSGLTIHLQRVDKPFADTDFSRYAALLLGLIGNADTVTVASGGEAYTLTAAAASKNLHLEVKRLGQDQRLLERYLAEIAD